MLEAALRGCLHLTICQAALVSVLLILFYSTGNKGEMSILVCGQGQGQRAMQWQESGSLEESCGLRQGLFPAPTAPGSRAWAGS